MGKTQLEISLETLNFSAYLHPNVQLDIRLRGLVNKFGRDYALYLQNAAFWAAVVRDVNALGL